MTICFLFFFFVILSLFCLQEKATKWQEGRDIDGLTTNGILLMHPQGSFCGGDSEPGVWREVSVCGGIYSLRESRSAQKKGRAVSTSKTFSVCILGKVSILG